MHYRVFYFFERSGESVSSTSAVTMSARDIREQLLGRLHSGDDYLGIIDAEENVLQILCEPDGERFWVELPIEAAKASFGCHMGFDELQALIESLPEVFDRQSLPDLRYKPW
jgi:hypothetical protein